MADEKDCLCVECGEEFDELTEDSRCPECGQEYVFPPVKEENVKVLTPDGSSEEHDTVEEAVNAEGGMGEERTEEQSNLGNSEESSEDDDPVIWNEKGLNQDFQKSD